jgi:hypothetical protein
MKIRVFLTATATAIILITIQVNADCLTKLMPKKLYFEQIL